MEENSAITYLAIVFDASSFSDLLARIDAIGDIMRADKLAYEELVTARQLTMEAKIALEESMAESEAQKEELVAKETELLSQIDQSLALIAEIEATLEAHNEMYDALDSEADKIQADINKKTEELRKQEAAAAAAGRNNTAVKGTGTFQWPSPSCNIVTSKFGSRYHPIYKEVRIHQGIDVGAKYGSLVVAADSGKVITSAYSSSYGNYVVISHGDGITTLYAHLSQRLVAANATVTKGQNIGKVGSTGASTGPHLHFEISVNGSRKNPLSYFSGYVLRID
jgi:murein DD-endopeptidase MepM/ murein hydrolase activator NlpD